MSHSPISRKSTGAASSGTNHDCEFDSALSMPSDNHENRRQARSTQGRKFDVALPGTFLDRIQLVTQKQTYRGLRFPKDPFDIALYMRLIELLKPASIIEVGTSQGGGALWFSDICTNLGLDTRILTIDL